MNALQLPTFDHSKNLKNTMAQDAFLCAKGWYGTGRTVATKMFLIFTAHMGMSPQHFSFAHTAEALMGRTIDVLAADPSLSSEMNLSSLALEMGPSRFDLITNPKSLDMHYYERLVELLSSRIACLRVLDNANKWRLPFPKVEPDQDLHTYVRDMELALEASQQSLTDGRR